MVLVSEGATGLIPKNLLSSIVKPARDRRLGYCYFPQNRSDRRRGIGRRRPWKPAFVYIQRTIAPKCPKIRRWQKAGRIYPAAIALLILQTETLVDRETAGASQRSQSTACIQHSAQIPRDRPNVSTGPAGDQTTRKILIANPRFPV